MFFKRKNKMIQERQEKRQAIEDMRQSIIAEETEFANRRANIMPGNKTLVINNLGANKIQAIKLVAEITGKKYTELSGELFENPVFPYVVIANISLEDAIAMKEAFLRIDEKLIGTKLAEAKGTLEVDIL